MVRSGEVSCSDLQRAPSHWVLLVSHLVRGLIPSWGSTLMTIANSNHLPKALLQMPPHCGVRGSTYGFGGGDTTSSHILSAICHPQVHALLLGFPVLYPRLPELSHMPAAICWARAFLQASLPAYPIPPAPNLLVLFPSFFPAVSNLDSSPSISEGCSVGMVD